jgi:hypothetical protein
MAHDFTGDASITRRTKKMPHKDPEKHKEYQRKYSQENAEKKKEYHRKWYQENAEKKKKNYRKWSQENAENKKEYYRKYCKENPDKVNARNAKRRAYKLQRTPHWLTEEEVFMIKEAYSLAKLREKTTGIKWHVDHIVPLKGDTVSGLHCPENLQVIPGSENISKKNNWNWDEQR